MTTILDTISPIRDAIEAAGVRCTLDPIRVKPPCALVVATEAEFRGNCIGSGTTRVTVHVLGATPGSERSMQQLVDMVSVVLQVVPGIRTATASSYSTDGGGSWPSFDLDLIKQAQWC